MIEVELKAQIQNFNNLLSKLKCMGFCYDKKIKQVDSVYYFYSSERPNKTRPIKLRFRDDGKKNTLTLKRRLANDLTNMEIESRIIDRPQMEEIIKELGCKKILTIEKTRLIGRYKNTTVCLDRVKGLGNYIEVERIASSIEEAKLKQRWIKKFLTKLGIKERNIINRGYDTILLKLNKPKI